MTMDAPMLKGNILWKESLLPLSKENPLPTEDVGSGALQQSVDAVTTAITSLGGSKTLATLETALGNLKDAIEALMGVGDTTSTLADLESLLNTLSDKDFATETKLEAVRVLLASVKDKDFATETKLEAVRALLEAMQSGDSADYGLLEILVGHVGGDLLNDLAGSKALLQSLDDFIQSFSSFVALPKLESIEGKLGELETELATIRQQQVDGSSKVQLSGNMAELSSTQYSEVATTVKTYTCDGASRIEVFVESGRVRIRTDGQPCTAVTGEPLGEGFGAMWSCTSISVLYISDAVITVVIR